jgi:alkanesulfonate monooxygenase SsuD/methylene tetrahydromethanopterin reductase-like flavin-dependent oxidoreductase (luciferase family)
MDVGIGLPNAVRGVQRDGIVDWAQRAEAAGFSSLGTIDRIAYPNWESLICLGAAAAVTERIGLLTDILLSPLRTNWALYAKQAATIDNLSGGRLTLGLAVGGRPDDYAASGVDFESRGKTFDAQLQELTTLWGSGGEHGVGPEPVDGKRPKILIGGSSKPAYRRAAQYGDGWTMGGGTPDDFKAGLETLKEHWRSEGRDGEPRTSALFYFSLGDAAQKNAEENIGDYYAFLGDYTSQVVDSAAKDADTIKGYMSAFEEAGCDEVVCFPASSDPDQVELLAEAAGL